MTGYRSLHADFGVEISGLDLCGTLEAAAGSTLLSALHQHALLLFRSQALDAADFPRIAAAIGQRCSELKRYETPGPSPDQAWHCVGAIGDEPARATVLCCREAPANGGGMAFVSTRALWRRLPPELCSRLRSLRGVHSFRAAPECREAYPLLPDGGIPAPFMGYHLRSFEGVAQPEAENLITMLMTEATRADAICAITLAPGDVLIWLNNPLMHRACAVIAGERRVIEEVSVYGEAGLI
jgi:alpha-ketoglutarate-dependent taurine dioxygenase